MKSIFQCFWIFTSSLELIYSLVTWVGFSNYRNNCCKFLWFTKSHRISLDFHCKDSWDYVWKWREDILSINKSKTKKFMFECSPTILILQCFKIIEGCSHGNYLYFPYHPNRIIPGLHSSGELSCDCHPQDDAEWNGCEYFSEDDSVDDCIGKHR